MDTNKLREKASQGGTAHFLEKNLEPYLKSIEFSLLSNLKNIYRDDTKEKSNSVLLAKLAGLCVVDDIRAKIKTDINLGNAAHKELLK